MLSFMVSIWLVSWDPSKVMIDAAITDLLTPQALPKALLDGTNT